MTATPSAQTSSAHACTADLRAMAPAALQDTSSIWIKTAAENRAAAAILWCKAAEIKSSTYCGALVKGSVALRDAAISDEYNAIERGLLLCIGAPTAIDLAEQIFAE